MRDIKPAAFAEKVEVEGYCNEEPQPLVTLCAIPNRLPLRNRLRLRDMETKNLSLSNLVCDANLAAFAGQVEA